MKVLIMGATGLLGKAVINNMEKENFNLRLFSRSINASDFNEKHEVVKGDVFNDEDLKNALKGCDAVHITMSKIDEALSTKAVVNAAMQEGIKLISYVSGSTVSEENRWFPMIDKKMKAEKAVIESGIPYIIFRPTWFFESLNWMITKDKAMMLGKKPKAWHWVATDDFGKMVCTAFLNEEAKNKIFYIHGPEKHKMPDLLAKLVKKKKLKNQKISPTPLGLLRFIAFITGKKPLKQAVNLFSYFEKVDEQGDPTEANNLLGAPLTTFEKWMEKQ